jgi:hypothetical protein
MMRVMLYEAAQAMMRSKKWSWLKAWAMQIARRRGMKKAIVALARRDANLHILAEFLRRTTEWCGNPKPNFTISYATNRIVGASRFLPERMRER